MKSLLLTALAVTFAANAQSPPLTAGFLPPDLNWSTPHNQDGSVVPNLTGFRIHWGQQYGNYTVGSATLNDPYVRTWTPPFNLAPGVWYFIVAPLVSGQEISPSAVAIKTIAPAAPGVCAK